MDILGVPISTVNIASAVEQIGEWIGTGSKHYVTVTGVHGIMESQDSPEILAIHRQAGMCVPDGMPTVWLGHYAGAKHMDRVYGPDLMLAIMEQSPSTDWRHFFFGGKEGVANLLQSKLEHRFPGVQIVGTYCPPFRAMRKKSSSFGPTSRRRSPGHHLGWPFHSQAGKVDARQPSSAERTGNDWRWCSL